MSEIDSEAVSRVVAEEWCRVLAIPEVNRGDDFFAFGGNSTHAIELMSCVEDRLGMAFPMEALFLEGKFCAVVEACIEVLRAG